MQLVRHLEQAGAAGLRLCQSPIDCVTQTALLHPCACKGVICAHRLSVSSDPAVVVALKMSPGDTNALPAVC
jgi:hypothetical protein